MKRARATLAVAGLLVGLVALPAPARAEATDPVAPADLVPTIVTTEQPRLGASAGFDVVVLNAGGLPAAGPVKVQLLSGLGPLELSGDGWLCDAEQQSCQAVAAAVGEQALPPLHLRTAPLTRQGNGVRVVLSGLADGVRTNNEVSVSPAVLPDEGAELVPTLRGLGTLDVANKQGFAVSVTNLGRRPHVGDVHLQVRGASDLAASGVGWTCDQSSCDHAGPVAVGASLPELGLQATMGPGRRPLDVQVLPSAEAAVALAVTGRTFGYGTDLTPIIDPPAALRAGQVPSYGVRVRNAGTVASSREVRLLLGDLQGHRVTASGLGWSCNDAPETFPGYANDDVLCRHPGPVPAAGELAPVSVVGAVPALRSTHLDASASLLGTGEGADENDSTLLQLLAGGVAVDAAVHLTPSGPFRAGVTVPAAIAVMSHGTEPLTGPTDVSLELPAGWTATAAGPGWTCLDGATCRTQSPEPGALTAQVTAPVDAAGSAVVAARLRHDGDVLAGDDLESLSWPVAPASGPGTLLVDVVSDAQGPPPAGGAELLTVTVRNRSAFVVGPGPLVLEASPGSSAAVVAGCDADCTLPALAPGEQAVVTVRQQVDGGATGPVSLRASAGGGADTLRRAVLDTGPDLVATVTAQQLGVRGAQVAFRVRTTNAGVSASSARTVLRLSTPDTLVDAHGDGWTCFVPERACLTDETVTAGAGPADLTVTTEGHDQRAPARLAVALANDDDSVTADDQASATAPSVGVLGPDLVVELRPVDPVRRGGGPTRLDAIVHNVGTVTHTGRIVLDRFRSAAGLGWSCPPDQLSCTTDLPVPPGASLPAVRTEGTTDRDPPYRVTVQGSPQEVERGNNSSWISPAADPDPAHGGLVALVQPAEPVVRGDVAQHRIEVLNTGVEQVQGPVVLSLVPDRPVNAAVRSNGAGVVVATSGEGWSCTGRTCTHPGPVLPGLSLPELTVDLGTTVEQLSTGLEAGLFTPADLVELPGNGNHVVIGIGGSPAEPAVLVREAAPLVPGRTTRLLAQVSNAGGRTTDGPVTVHVGAHALGVRASGPSWTCTPESAGVACASALALLPGVPAPDLAIDLDVPEDRRAGTGTVDLTLTPRGARTSWDTTQTVVLPGVTPAPTTPAPPTSTPTSPSPSPSPSVTPTPSGPVPSPAQPPADPVRVAAVSPGTTGLQAPTVVTLSRPFHGSTADLVQLRTSAGAVVLTRLTCAPAPCSGPVFRLALTPAKPLEAGASYRVVSPALGYAGALFRAVRSVQETATSQAWASITDPRAIGGHESLERTTGAAWTSTFSGTGTRLWFGTGPDHGRAALRIDGRQVAVLDLWAPTRRYRQSRTITGLAPGAHTIQLVVLGTRRAASSGTWVRLDAHSTVASTCPTASDCVRDPASTFTWRRLVARAATDDVVAVSSTPGARLALRFTGTGVRVHSTTGPTTGTYRLYVDGVLRATVSGRTAAAGLEQTDVRGLANRSHVVQVVVVTGLVGIDRLDLA